MSTRIHPHSPLPAPAMRASTPSVQSKSHVLAGVQDAYWSDDETEDTECPLCLEEMDISDINFKPCPCGYQICRFCWHHIKENLNRRCPACRREYSDEAVQFKPINKEDHKRLTQQKKQKERERKDLEALGRRHLANVRVVQRNVVYVIGIGQKFAKEELIPTLRTHEYFGQYGKISKIVITKRTSTGGRAPVVGLYITFHRREDAARCISAVDGAPSPSGGGEVMRASYGTTKYCMAFLRGVSCPDHSCLNLHEWGDENDCFTKEDLTTLKHTMKDTESRARKITVVKKGDESEGLPRAASWANKGINSVVSSALHNSTTSGHIQPAINRQVRRLPAATRTSRTTSSTVISSAFPALREKRPTGTTNKAPSVDSSSRPATPAGALTPQRVESPTISSKPPKPKERPPSPLPRQPSPAEVESGIVAPVEKEPTPPTSPPDSSSPSPAPAPSAPPGLPAVPPGLSAPPGLPPPSRPPLSVESSPQLPMQGPYQMSTQAQALFEDIKARRELSLVSSGPSPFPDLDRMLQSLTEDSGFSFSLDPKLAGNDQDHTLDLSDLDSAANSAFSGNFFDAFPNVRHVPPPGLGYPPQLDIQTSNRSPAPSTSSSYTGSFNPFATDGSDEGSRQYSPLDDDRKVSRFGFARGRQGSASMSNTASPIHLPPSLSLGDHSSQSPYFNQPEIVSATHGSPGQWNYVNRHHEYLHQSSSAMSSPLAQHAQAYTPYSNHFQQQQQQVARQQQYDTTVSEAQLRELINSSRDRSMRSGSADSSQFKFTMNQPFSDPAIMSARLASPVVSQQTHDSGYSNLISTAGSYQSQQHIGFGPPPGLSFPSGAMTSPSITGRQGLGMGSSLHSNMDLSQAGGAAQVSNCTSPVPSPALSSTDFPALAAADVLPAEEQPQPSDPPTPSTLALDLKAQAKAERLAAKKAASEERAAARRKLAEERAVAKAAEKEKAAVLKAEKERIAKEKAEEQAVKEKVERERFEKQRLERERMEKEKAREREEKERAQLEARKVANAAKAAKQTTSAKAASRIEAENPAMQLGRAAATRSAASTKQAPTPALNLAEPAAQAPILARMPKKNKPVTRPIKIPKEDVHDNFSALASAATSDVPQLPDSRDDSASRSRSESVDRNEPMTLEDLFAEIDLQVPWMRLAQHPFFDMTKINPAAKMPLEYGPLVHALSALSVGGGSFADNMPSGSIDHAVSSFQQLLETLTQTISDLLRLLPRTTWDDSSSFDGVLRDMLRGDDFLEDGDEEQGKQGKEDEVTALTLALERRARWMEVQLSKLEELHHDINTAAVRAVLSFNDNGWDPHGFMPRMGNTLQKFDQIGIIIENGVTREMTADELEKKLVVAKEHAVFAETELREAMQGLQAVKPYEEEEY
ncbi:hypothetical protein BDY19DRAFT_920744 [Irpex rosettiformis]|uniref:Uncharacterized protein n=1 Tax=Irpex rosettiformis TaxID=378272 RepID=A0ACB8UID4_9APHY|nr:hypothetical protein BDY19DRAFT_920744 [Irpex rosettiformis]